MGDFRRLADQFLGCASHLIVTLKTKLERNKALLLLHRTQKPVLGVGEQRSRKPV